MHDTVIINLMQDQVEQRMVLLEGGVGVLAVVAARPRAVVLLNLAENGGTLVQHA